MENNKERASKSGRAISKPRDVPLYIGSPSKPIPIEWIKGIEKMSKKTPHLKYFKFEFRITARMGTPANNPRKNMTCFASKLIFTICC